MRRRTFMVATAGISMGIGGATAGEDWMLVRLGGQRYRLPRALDDGASDQPDPSGGNREEILLRADLPRITPHVPNEELRGQSPFLGSMIEILASSIAQSPEQQKTLRPEDGVMVMRRRLGALFDPAHPEKPRLTTVPTDGLAGPVPKGNGIGFVTAPPPWDSSFPKVYFCGDPSAPTDIISAGGGECVQTFIYATAVFRATYGVHLIETWESVRANIEQLFERSKV